jgi:3',5'-cyclic AMP phosphodiesterase CpdA
MRLGWATDIHLNFLRDAELADFCQALCRSQADAFLITGDIAEAASVVRFLEGVDRAVGRPIYFVLGNHDYYGGSVANVRAAVSGMCDRSERLRWLGAGGIVELTPDIALVGHDGWADGRAGDWDHSTVMLNDYVLIWDLVGLRMGDRLKRMQRLAAESADALAELLPRALARYRRVVVGTHVPPLREACWHDGKISDDNWLPHFTSIAMGDALMGAARAHPESELLVLCGHTHGAGVTRPLPNLEVRTGGAEYGAPALADVLTF